MFEQAFEQRTCHMIIWLAVAPGIAPGIRIWHHNVMSMQHEQHIMMFTIINANNNGTQGIRRQAANGKSFVANMM